MYDGNQSIGWLGYYDKCLVSSQCVRFGHKEINITSSSGKREVVKCTPVWWHPWSSNRPADAQPLANSLIIPRKLIDFFVFCYSISDSLGLRWHRTDHDGQTPLASERPRVVMEEPQHGKQLRMGLSPGNLSPVRSLTLETKNCSFWTTLLVLNTPEQCGIIFFSPLYSHFKMSSKLSSSTWKTSRHHFKK